MSDQNPEARPARRRVVRRAAAPPPAAPPAQAPVPPEAVEAESVEDEDLEALATEDDASTSTEASTPAASTADLGAELAQLATSPRRRAVRKKAAPVAAVSDIALPGSEPSTSDAPADDDAPAPAAKKAAGRKSTTAKKTTARKSRAAEAAPDDDDAPAGGRAAQATADVRADDAPADETPTDESAAEAAPAEKAPARKRATRKATAAQGSAEKSAAKEPAAKAPAAKASADQAPSAPRLATTAVLFQAPDPSLAKSKRRRVTAEAGSPQAVREQVESTDSDTETTDDVGSDETTAESSETTSTRRGSRSGSRSRSRSRSGGKAEETTAPEDDAEQSAIEGDQRSEDDNDEDQDDSDGSSSSRRRRRRGGRGRRGRGTGDDSGQASSGDADSQSDSDSTNGDDSAAADSGQSDDTDEEGSSRRRRRRRSRSGRSGESDSGGRSDEVTALRGSTRLEAKRQRRREGRDAGRRRQILTESEFLARRESVERAMVVRESNGRTQIAVLEDGVLAEHYVSRTTQASMLGNVYLGRVQNVLPSMEAAFVDVGKGRNAVLYAGEVNWDAAGLEGQPRRIETALKSGDSVLVQVTKDPIGHKGARLTSQITLAGRYLVFVPGAGMTGISRKLPETERARLKKLLREIVPENSGVIVRTAAEGASEEELRADIARLTEQWAKIEKKAKTASAPSLLQGEADLAIRVVRDIFNDDFASLVVQGKEAWDTISGYVGDLAPDLSSKLSRWTSEKDVFAEHRIDEQIAKAMDRKVWLPSGGSLVIDRTEAMTVVDVNTGKFTGTGGTLEETVTRNNIEAAEEIVRQLRLRDIGGIIVIDFIDMVLESNRDLVLRRLVECLGRDRTKHQVAEVTSLGLVQMTRKRVGQGLLEAFSEPCAHCAGRGYTVHDHPVDKGGQPAAEDAAEPKKSRRSRKSPTPEVVPHTPVPVLPTERDKVNATLATIAAAAAHAHDVEAAEAAVAPTTEPAAEPAAEEG